MSISVINQNTNHRASAPVPHLTNRGGRILTEPRIFSLYYGRYWNSASGRGEASQLNKFGAYLVKSSHMSIWREYGIRGARYAGHATVSAKAPQVIDEAGIQEIVQKYAARQSTNDNSQTIYTVYLPPGTILEADGGVNSLNGLGGYHGSVDTLTGRLYYAAITYAQGANGIDFTGKAVDNISIIASHEWSETATDPDVNKGKLGWYDNNYGEVGDIPIAMGLPLSESYERIGGYAVQKEWSNKDRKAEVVREK